MKKILLAVAFTYAAIASYAQTADDIVGKYLTAMGGADNWKKINNTKQTGFVVVQGLNIPYTALYARPNLMYTEGEFQGNKFIEAFDGTVAWGQNPFAGSATPTQKTEEETKEAAKEAFEDDFIDYKTKGHSLELNGTEEIEGTKCHKLTMKRKSGDEKIYFIDAETHFPVCIRAFVTTGPNKGQAVDMFSSDYKLIEGVQIPHTIEQKVGGQTAVTIKMEKIEVNATIDKAQFSMPKETAKN